MFRRKPKYSLEDFSRDLQDTVGRFCDFWDKKLESSLDVTYVDKKGKKTVKTEKANAFVHIVRLLTEILAELRKKNV